MGWELWEGETKWCQGFWKGECKMVSRVGVRGLGKGNVKWCQGFGKGECKVMSGVLEKGM